MKWIGITGSWRITNQQVEDDVRKAVRDILRHGNGIVTGGALNVDFFATDEVLRNDPTLKRLKIFIPASLEIYSAHYRKRAKEKIITRKQAENLITQLNRVKEINPYSIIENTANQIVNEETYFRRNQEIINASDELYAFQVNNSKGVEDTIKKAKKKGMPVKLYSYKSVASK